MSRPKSAYPKKLGVGERRPHERIALSQRTQNLHRESPFVEKAPTQAHCFEAEKAKLALVSHLRASLKSESHRTKSTKFPKQRKER